MKRDRKWYRTVEGDALWAVHTLHRLGLMTDEDHADKIADIRAAYFQEDYTALVDLRDHWQLRLQEHEAGV